MQAKMSEAIEYCLKTGCCNNCTYYKSGWPDMVSSCSTMLKDAVQQLKLYEGAGEKHTVQIPCVVGDKIYYIRTMPNGGHKIFCMTVSAVDVFGAIMLHGNGICRIWNICAECYMENGAVKEYFQFSDFGEKIFLSHEEAKDALNKIVS